MEHKKKVRVTFSSRYNTVKAASRRLLVACSAQRLRGVGRGAMLDLAVNVGWG